MMSKEIIDEEDIVINLSNEDRLFLKETIDLYKNIEKELYKHFDLPKTTLGQILAISDGIDNLVMRFGVGEKPSSSGDPFKMRRDENAVIRIMIECGLDLDLKELLIKSKEICFPNSDFKVDPVEPLLEFFKERLRSYYIKGKSKIENPESVNNYAFNNYAFLIINLDKKINSISHRLEKLEMGDSPLLDRISLIEVEINRMVDILNKLNQYNKIMRNLSLY